MRAVESLYSLYSGRPSLVSFKIATKSMMFDENSIDIWMRYVAFPKYDATLYGPSSHYTLFAYRPFGGGVCSCFFADVSVLSVMFIFVCVVVTPSPKVRVSMDESICVTSAATSLSGQRIRPEVTNSCTCYHFLPAGCVLDALAKV